MKTREKTKQKQAKGWQNARKLKTLGFHKNHANVETTTETDPPEIGDNGRSTTQEWQQMDQEAEDCRRNGAFSFSRD